MKRDYAQSLTEDDARAQTEEKNSKKRKKIDKKNENLESLTTRSVNKKKQNEIVDNSIICFICKINFDLGNSSKNSWLTCKSCTSWSCYNCLPIENKKDKTMEFLCAKCKN